MSLPLLDSLYNAPEILSDGKPANKVRLGNWGKLFSLKPSLFYLHNVGSGQVYDVISETFITVANGTSVVGRFGDEFDTNGNARHTANVSSGTQVSVFTFVRYNSNAIDHAIADWSAQSPVIWADTAVGELRASMFAGTSVVGTAASLSNDTPGYLGTGYHCWGGTISSNDATSTLFVDGIAETSGNPGTFTNDDTATVYDNDGSNKTSDANYIWTIFFPGKLPDYEAEYITRNPEEIYRILEAEPAWLPLFVAAAGGRIMGSLAGQGGLAGMGGIAGPHGGLAG